MSADSKLAMPSSSAGGGGGAEGNARDNRTETELQWYERESYHYTLTFRQRSAATPDRTTFYFRRAEDRTAFANAFASFVDGQGFTYGQMEVGK